MFFLEFRAENHSDAAATRVLHADSSSIMGSLGFLLRKTSCSFHSYNTKIKPRSFEEHIDQSRCRIRVTRVPLELTGFASERLKTLFY